jgi:hypothetical protein
MEEFHRACERRKQGFLLPRIMFYFLQGANSRPHGNRDTTIIRSREVSKSACIPGPNGQSSICRPPRGGGVAGCGHQPSRGELCRVARCSRQGQRVGSSTERGSGPLDCPPTSRSGTRAEVCKDPHRCPRPKTTGEPPKAVAHHKAMRIWSCEESAIGREKN